MKRVIESHKTYKVICQSKYFTMKYGDNPTIQIEKEIDYHHSINPAGFHFIGRVLAEGRQELFKVPHYYGYVEGLGEIIHESEIGDEVDE